MKLLNLKLTTFTLLFGMLVNPLFSQEIVEKPISEFKSPGFSCKYEKNGNTDGYIYIGYQNPVLPNSVKCGFYYFLFF